MANADPTEFNLRKWPDKVVSGIADQFVEEYLKVTESMEEVYIVSKHMLRLLEDLELMKPMDESRRESFHMIGECVIKLRELLGEVGRNQAPLKNLVHEVGLLPPVSSGPGSSY
jgi:hypothetical protein